MAIDESKIIWDEQPTKPNINIDESKIIWDKPANEMKYLGDEASKIAETPKDFIQVPLKDQKQEAEAPSLLTQYQIGLMSKVVDEETRVKNALRIFDARGYSVEDYTKKEGGIKGLGDSYVYNLTDKKSGKKFKLDETGLQQGLISMVGDIGQYGGMAIGGILGVAGAATGSAVGNAFDQYLSYAITGEELDATQRSVEVGKAMAETLALITGEKIIAGVSKGVGTITKNITSELTAQERTLAEKAMIPENEAWNLIKDLPKEQRALELANYGAGRTKGLMENALATEPTKEKYIELINSRRNALEETVGKANFEQTKQLVSTFFNDVKTTASKIPLDKPFDGNIISEAGEKLRSNVSTTNKASELVDKMINSFKDRPASDVGELIDLRVAMNYEYTRAKGGSKGIWKEAKDTLDSFLSENVDKNLIQTLDKSNALYSNMKSTEEVLNLLNKESIVSTVGKGSQYGEIGAVNWAKLNEELKDVYIASPELKNTVDLVEKFTKKFGDMDTQLFSKAVPKGEKLTESVIAGSPVSHLQRLGVKELFEWMKSTIPLTEAYYERKATLAIRESIEKSNSQVEFLNNVRRNINTPESLKSEIDDMLKGIDTSAKNISIQRYESAKKIKEAQDLQLNVNKAEINIDVAQQQVDRYTQSLSTMTQSGKANPETISKLRDNLDLAERKLEVAIQEHAKKKDAFDAVNIELEKMKKFMTPRQSENRPEAISKREAMPIKPVSFIQAKGL